VGPSVHASERFDLLQVKNTMLHISGWSGGVVAVLRTADFLVVYLFYYGIRGRMGGTLSNNSGRCTGL